MRGSSPPRFESFTVTVDNPLPAPVKEHKWSLFGKDHFVMRVQVPAQAAQVIDHDHEMEIELPEDMDMPAPSPDQAGRLVYSFPKKCSLPRPPVDRWKLAQVIGLAVAVICLWGTLIGSMLPLFFHRLGIDPGVASSPFVATFVDVTGIIVSLLYRQGRAL